MTDQKNEASAPAGGNNAPTYSSVLSKAEGLCATRKLSRAWIRQKLKAKPVSRFEPKELRELDAELDQFVKEFDSK